MLNECKLSIITVNYNGFKDTCELIDSIPFNKDMEVIVVDNASKEDEASIISNQYPKAKVIRSDKNLGFAGGNNLGIKEAKGDYILLINNDTYFKEFNIDNLIKRLDSSDKIGIVCPKIRFVWGNNPIQFAGYMPECYFLYYEEIDWSMIFTRAGYEIWYDPACTVYHKESQTTGQNSPLRTYYITRNRLLLVKRNYKGINKYLSYIYLIGIVAPRDIVKYALQGRFDLVKSVCRGLFTIRYSLFT